MVRARGPAEGEAPIAQAQVLGTPLSFHPESSVQVSTSTSINRPPPINHHNSFRDFPLHAIKQPPLQFNFVPFHQAGKSLLIVVNNNFSGFPSQHTAPTVTFSLSQGAAKHTAIVVIAMVTHDTLTFPSPHPRDISNQTPPVWLSRLLSMRLQAAQPTGLQKDRCGRLHAQPHC